MLLALPAALVWQAIQGQWMSSCLGVLLELHIPDLLAQEDKPIALNKVIFFSLANMLFSVVPD